MKSIAVVLSLFLACSHAIIPAALLIQEQWQNFKLEHDKVYESEYEERYRFAVYRKNLHEINEHNKLYELGLSSYKMTINQFSDLSEEEFLKLYTFDMSQLANLTAAELWGGDSEDSNIICPPPSNVDENDLSEEVNWKSKGYVTSVKNQGRCGSCWSFSAAGALEGQWFKSKSKLVELSEQNLVDCSGSEGNHGCRGGWMPSAFNYIIKNKGIDTAASYPYTGKDGSCHFNAQTIGATVSKVVIVPQGENQLKSTVSQVGPVAFAMQVIGSFYKYGGGVYDDPRCGHSLNHAMLIVGYGNEKGKDYWLVKNSWGTGWGESGYVKMARNKNNQCGVASAASYPVV